VRRPPGTGRRRQISRTQRPQRRRTLATINQEIVVNAQPEHVWDAIRDVGAVHERLAPGFVVNTVLEADARVVTFASGLVARELIVDVDDRARRLVWAVVESPRLTHHNASLQVFAEGDARSRVVWIADLLPHETAKVIRGMIEQGMAAMKTTLERDQSKSVSRTSSRSDHSRTAQG
jgi:hypothetical protein